MEKEMEDVKYYVLCLVGDLTDRLDLLDRNCFLTPRVSGGMSGC